jgi:hypothetical protein
MQASDEQGFRYTDEVSMKDSQEDEETSVQYEQELKRSIHLLKISQDSQMAETAFELIKKSRDQLITFQHGKWTIVLNAIAGSCFLNQRVLSQTEMYDFLTVAVTTSLQARTKTIDNIIFRIYKDIMANYESADEKLKMAYPKLIVDVVAILVKGLDTRGNKIALHNLEHYYQTRKTDAISSTFATTSETPVATATATAATATATAAAASIKSIKRDVKREKPFSSAHIEPYPGKGEEEAKLIEVLTKITNRNKKDIQASVAKLERRDVTRIKDLSKNYNRIQEYSKLITDKGHMQKLKVSLEKDAGKGLSRHQIQHAANSVRKVKLYVENVLDGKFKPHGSYGINHTKHNLEYGYLIVGLMHSSRKRPATT